MPIVEPLPPSVRSALRDLTDNSQPTRIAISTDIDGGGQFGQRWFVATEDHAYVFLPEDDKARLLHAVPLKDISQVRAEFLVGSGVLEVDTNGKVLGLLRYSHTLAPRFAKVARLLQSMVDNEDVSDDEEDEDSRCESCGRLLPEGTKVCPACLNKTKVLIRLLALTRPYRAKLSGAVVLLLLATGLGLVSPYLGKPLFDNFTNKPVQLPYTLHVPGWTHRLDVLVTLVLAYLIIWFASWLVAIRQGRILAWLGSRLTLDLRAQLYETLQRLSLSYFDKRQLGSIMARVTQDTSALNSFMNQSLNIYIGTAIFLLGACAWMFYLSWQLALWVLAPSPIIAILSFLFFKRLMRRHHRYWHMWSRIAAVLHDSLAGIRVIRAFAQEDQEVARFSQRATAVYDAEVQLSTASNTFWPTIGLLTQFSTAIVWLIGGYGVIRHQDSPGTLLAFLGYINIFYAHLQTICRGGDFLSSSLTATDRIFEVLDQQIEIADAPNPVRLPTMRGEVEFRNVNFGYEAINPVLKDVTLHVQPGEMIGLVGHSGAGKTTLINLLCRFYDVTDGAILIDGTNVREIAMKDLRSQIGVVLQDPFLFNGTIIENIAYARRDATREQVIRAAKAANAHEFIMKLPDGYDSQVGERGGRLSGGERQRISIARAILCDPRILVLDEATSSVDTQAESQIQQALTRLVANRTTFAIAHRLSTLRQAHRLVVLEDGKIAETGSHDELMERHGVYRRLVEIQNELSKIKAVEG